MEAWVDDKSRVKAQNAYTTWTTYLLIRYILRTSPTANHLHPEGNPDTCRSRGDV
jgi:hypothetical protein